MASTVPGVFSSILHPLSNGAHGLHESEDTSPLNIIVCGAGIGGLAAAIALRKQGHNVILVEQWNGAGQTGAAVHIQPNANGLLRRFGIFVEDFGGNLMLRHTEYNQDGSQIMSTPLEGVQKMWQHPWMLVHRVHLHAALSKVAVARGADLRLSTRVASVDAENATVTLLDGTQLKGDLIVGADGVSSVARAQVPGGHVKAVSSGKSAFRFLLTKSEVNEPRLDKFLKAPEGELVIQKANDRRIVIYPCGNNTLLNFVCIHPDQETAAPSPLQDWDAGGSVKALLNVYKDFDDTMKLLLAQADPSTLRVWKLLDMEQMPTFVHKKLALIGDAAHPFTPHQGQGAGVAMEDAIALAVVLPAGTKRSEIEDRLNLYNECRYERAHIIQEYSRIAGRDMDDPHGAVDMMSFANYNMGHDEWDSATKKLEEWDRCRNPNIWQRMPIAFGPMPGPRQALFTQKAVPASHSTFTTASVKFKTSRTFLQNLFPTTSFRFKGPGTSCYASWSQTTLGKMDWLGGSGYSHLGLYVHGVEYIKHCGALIQGTYLPLLFENLADPIISGRDEIGMPKVFCNINIRRGIDSYTIRCSWQGASFMSIDIPSLIESDSNAEPGTFGVTDDNDNGLLLYKYIPATPGPNTRLGDADAAYPVFIDHKKDSEVVRSTVSRTWASRHASIKIDKLTQQDLPTLHHIVSKLQEMPIFEVVQCKVVEGTGVPDVSSAQRIE